MLRSRPCFAGPPCGPAAALLAILLAAAPAAHGQTVAQRVVTASDAWLNVTSDGVLGNDFTSRTPSFEYPIGSGFEHLTHGGLWIGAHAQDALGAFTAVVTGGIDQNLGLAPGALSEWTPVSAGFTVRSNLPNSALYDPTALSPDESVVLYDDRAPRNTASNPEPNRPVGLRVRQLTHAWNAAGYRDFAVVRFVLTSQTVLPVRDVWVGLYNEFASGVRDAYSCWPPAGACGPGVWSGRKRLEWDPAWRMLREHYCQKQPEPDSCHFEVVPPWVGLQLLTPPAAGQHVTLAAWNYAPGSSARDTDDERYAIMSAGTVTELADASLRPQTGDPVEVLAVGPFTLPGPDDSLEVAFAFVGGADVPSLQQHARSAQVLHDAGYRMALVDAGPPSPPSRLALTALANPSAADEPAFMLELPQAGRARIELFDPAGRHLAARDLGALPAGRHPVRLAGAARLTPGIYLARLTSADGRQVVARCVRLR
jgi:hypothetical protein